MLKSLALVFTLTACSALLPAAVAAQTPAGTATPASDQSATPVAAASEPTVSPAVAERTISRDGSVRGTTLEDDDSDGVASGVDKPRSTLVELQSHASIVDGKLVADTKTSQVISLLADATGEFRFTDAPLGNYVLWVWGYGFIGVNTAPTNPGLFQTSIVVAGDGTVTGALPASLLLKKAPEGVLGYPVRTGDADGPVPVGSVNVRQRLSGAIPAGLPATGEPGSSGSWLLMSLGLLLMLLAGAAMTVVAARRASDSRR